MARSPQAALRRYIDTTYGKNNLQAFAAAVGVTRPLVWMWIKGERTPGVETALRIQDATKIPARSWSARIGRTIDLARRD